MKLFISTLVSIFLIFPFDSICQINLSDGLITYLPLNGDGLDAGSLGNNITLTNGVYAAASLAGLQNDALSFNGAVEQGMGGFNGSVINGLSSASISYWFKVSSITNGMSLVGQDNILESGFYTSPNRIIVFHPTSGGVSYNLNINAEQWVHVVINTSPTAMQVFINGVSVGSQSGNFTIGSNATPTRIGGNVVNTSNNSWLRGALDEVRIYNRNLNQDEIDVLSSAVGVSLDPGSLASTQFCSGSEFNLPYTVIGSGLQAGNRITAQLSDASGSFDDPIELGFVNSLVSGSISATIPSDIPGGNGYKLRIVSSSPLLAGNESSYSLTISNPTEGLSTLNRGRILHYRFNGNLDDDSPSLADGTASGGATYVSDRFGNASSAIRLNGSNAFVDVPDNFWFDNSYTVSCWLKPESFGSFARIYDFGNAQQSDNVLACLSQQTNGRLAAQHYAGSVGEPILVAPSGTELNVWNHVLISFDGSLIRIYLNGNLIASAASVPARKILRTNCYIGRSNWPADAFAESAFDDFMIWNRALSVSEILVLANDGLVDSNSPVCEGATLQLSAPPIANAVYNWSGPSAFSGNTSQVFRPQITPAEGGNYTLNINVNGCLSGAQISAVTIGSNAQAPVVSLSGLPTATNTLADPSTLTGSPSGGYFSGYGIEGSTFNPSVSGAGTFVILYNAAGSGTCVNTAADTVDVGESFTMQNGTVNACSGGFYDTGGPNSNYSPNEDFTQTFCSDNGQRLRFNFNWMSLGTGDTLWAYDGNSADAELLRMFIAFSTPSVIWSSGSCITFRWKSNSTSQTTGWESQFECLENPETALSISMNAGISVVCNATILDPQGNSSYSPGFRRHTFKSATGSRLRFEYSVFAINGNNGGHWLRIYDGPDQTYPLIGQYNNFNFIPAAIVSSGEYLTFEFDANNTNAGFGGNAGFVGLLSCFGSPLPVYTMSNENINTCSGVFYDDAGPNLNFSPNQNNTQTFCSDNGQHIQFRFNNNVNLADSGDTLWVYDGPSTNDILLGYYIQGSNIERLTSSGTCLTFKFKSNTSTEPGWQGFITCVPDFPSQDTINISSGLRAVCNAIVSDNSGAFAYGVGFNRQTYRSYNGQRLRFEYSLFSINGNNGGHWLRIYDGPDQSYPLIGAYNNFSFIPATIESSGEFLTFEFDRNNTNAGFGSAQGYSGLMTCFGESLPVYNISNSTLSVCEGVFYDDGGPNSNYSPNGDYTQTFCSQAGQLIQIRFNRNESSFGSGDTLWVYDGSTVNDPPLAMYIAGSNIETLTSNGTCLTFKYVSNSSSQARGWQGFISCVNEPPAIINYNMSTGIRYVCNGVFRDPGGTGNYPDGIWNQTFTSYSGERLRVVVNGININGNNGGHWIRVYDGPSTASPLIGSYNNFNGWPPAFQSTSSSLTFRFESTNTFAGNTSGFEFEFSCFTDLPIDVAWLSSPVCQGQNLDIPFTINEPVNAGNVFTAQLSDANGNFGNPTNIGTINSEEEGEINASIPLSAIAGSGYRIRILSSNPVQIGSVSPNNIIINPAPAQPSSIQASNGLSICDNAEGTVLSVSAQQAVNYQWLLNGDQEIGSNSNQLVVSQAGIYSIEISNGCGSIVSNQTATVEILPAPQEAFINTSNGNTLCLNESTTLSVEPQAGVTYAWLANNFPVGSNQATLEVSESGTYTLTLTNSCGSAESLNNVDISDGALPILTLVDLTNVSCFGESNGAVDINAENANSFSWNTGQTTEDITGLGEGTYILTALSNDGCESTIEIEISEPQQISLTADVMPQIGVNANGSIDLTVEGGTPPYSFSWSNGEITEDLEGLEIGEYTVTATDSLNCEFSDTFVIDFVTLTSEISPITRVYPNPCSENFSIISGGMFQWSLIDISGRVIKTGNHTSHQEVVNVSFLASGVYYLNTISEEGGVGSVKIVLAR